jgi:2-dehydropantoate 2-reductase
MDLDKTINGPILIAGAGALGSVIGGMLRAAGRDVSLLGRPRHLDAIAQRGLIIDGLFGRREVSGFDLLRDAGELGRRRFAAIFVTVKSYDTAGIAALLARHLEHGGIAISAQNGLGNIEILARELGNDAVLGARVIFGAEIDQPGRVRVTVIAEPVAIGPAPDLSGSATPVLAGRAKQIAAALCAAAVPSQAVDDIRPLLWTKLFYNAALNPLGALLKLNYGGIGADPELRQIMDQIVEEAFAGARHAGVALAFESAADYRTIFYNRLLPATRDHYPSMLGDLERRGRTEIGALNGRIVEMANAAGLRAPANGMITALIHARERTWRRPAQEDR